jgi:hypothetical protein
MADMFVAKQLLDGDVCGHPDCFNRKGVGHKVAALQNLGPIIRTPHGGTHTKCFFRHLANNEERIADDLVPAAQEDIDE